MILTASSWGTNWGTNCPLTGGLYQLIADTLGLPFLTCTFPACLEGCAHFWSTLPRHGGVRLLRFFLHFVPN
jgi:hypothetical protein